jgi:hypothetical protein
MTWHVQIHVELAWHETDFYTHVVDSKVLLGAVSAVLILSHVHSYLCAAAASSLHCASVKHSLGCCWLP